MKHAFLAAVAVVALALPGVAFGASATHGSTTAKAKVAKPKPLGIVPGFIRTGSKPGQGKRVVKGVLKATAANGPTSSDNLTYNGPDQIPPASLKTLPRVMEGPVTVYTIFWQPIGFRTASNYQETVNQFFTDVQDESNTGTTPYDTDGQYYDDQSGVSNDLSFGASTQDFTPFPKSGCTTPKNLGGVGGFTVIGAKVCLSDAQIQKEVKAVADRMGWPHGPNTEFFMYTPHDVESCSGSDCSYSTYCAYHWYFGTNPSNEYIYANMPWPNQQFTANGNTYATDCDSGEHPNGGGGQTTGTEPGYPTDTDAADEVINVSSHENNEAITDPTGLGWWVDVNTADGTGGMEDGDLCAWWWPTDTGTELGGQADNGALYTNTIHGHNYFIQGEWSNIDANGEGNSGCQFEHNFPDFTELDQPSNGAVYSYEWWRCNSDDLSRGASVHHFAGAPGCKELRTYVTGNAAGGDPTVDQYTPTIADVGDGIFFCVAVYDGSDNGNEDCSSNIVAVTGEPELSDTAVPPLNWLTGSTESLVPGNFVTLAIPAGAFTSAPKSYIVTWKRCDFGPCSAIGKSVTVNAARTGSTTARYTIAPADVGQSLEATVVAKNAFGMSDTAETSDTSVVGGAPSATIEPSWTDESWTVGANATLNIGTWTAPTAAPITSFTVDLYRCPSAMPILTSCESISSQTLKPASNGHTITYKPVPDDVGMYVVAIITANSKWGVVFSAPNQLFASTGDAVGGLSELTGSLGVAVNTSLFENAVAWAFNMEPTQWSNSPTQFRYNVYRCTDPVDQATCVNELGPGGGASGRVDVASSGEEANAVGIYFPALDESGYYIRYTVQALNAAGFSAPVWSAAGDAPIPTVGDTPTSASDTDDNGGWDITAGDGWMNAVGLDQIAFACTDQTDDSTCQPVDYAGSLGDDTANYDGLDFPSASYIRFGTIGLSDDALSGMTDLSTSTGDLPSNATAPTVTAGTTGKVNLTVGTWDGGVNYAATLYRCTSPTDGSTCSPVDGETYGGQLGDDPTTYTTVKATDKGKYLRLDVIALDDAGSSDDALSTAFKVS
jgi:hypothetical protein